MKTIKSNKVACLLALTMIVLFGFTYPFPELFNILGIHNFSDKDFAVYQLITGPLLHASPLHLVGNLYALFYCAKHVFSEKNSGQEVYEEFDNAKVTFGVTGKHLVILGLGTFFSALVVATFSQGIAVGISGGLMALLGYGLFHWRYYKTQKSLLFDVLLIVVLGAIIPFISQSAHLGGLFFGAVCAFVQNFVDYKHFAVLREQKEGMQPEFVYIDKCSSLHILTGLNVFLHKAVRMAKLVKILLDPTKGYGKEHYKKEVAYLNKKNSRIFEIADYLRVGSDKPLSV